MLFKLADLSNKNTAVIKSAESLAISNAFTFLSAEKYSQLESKIGILSADKSIYFKTDGAWSAIDLVDYCLSQTGPADIYFSTWSIGPEAIRSFNEWKSKGLVKSISGIIDEGFRNRKPDLYQQALAAFPTLKFSKSHAKVTVIYSDTHQITLMGSANLTKNPRTEVGVIIMDKKLAEENIKWILDGIAKQ